MRLIRGLHNLKTLNQSSGGAGEVGRAVTIGNYDGVHSGHKQVLAHLVAQATSMGVPSTVVVFEPTPREFFQPEAAPIRLMSLRAKYRALAELGVDELLVLSFDAELASMSPDAFVKNILLAGLATRYLVVGDDFRFGANRAGGFDYLQTAGRQHGFAVSSTDTWQTHGIRVSSTRVRELLQERDLVTANEMLGRAYSISGKVVHGAKRGRQLGFPTANIRLLKPAALNGVYLVGVRLAADYVYGVANVGLRPTVDGYSHSVEVHIFDYDDDLYGQRIDVDFLDFIREEKKFESLGELQYQIKKDAGEARMLATVHIQTQLSSIDWF